MISRQQQNKIYGSPLRTIKPVISANSTYINDFAEYKADLPFDFIKITNNSNSHLDLYVDGTYFRILANETIGIDNRYFRNLKIITNSVAIAEGDLIINVQKLGMNADIKAKEDYIKGLNPLSKFGGFILGRLL